MTSLRTPPPPPPPKHVARAVIVLDPVGAAMTRSQEVELVVESYLERGVRLDWREAEVFRPGECAGADLIAFDWGGAAIGNSMMEDQLRRLLSWAADNASALVAIRSALARPWIEAEVSEHDLPPNVFLDLPRGLDFPPLPSWWLKGLKCI